ncbi:MAG: pantoate--beta-alanine ligase [Pirellulales bacterium]
MKAPARESSPLLVTDSDALRKQVARARRDGKSIGLVPTMGALHAGHLSLADAARRDCGFVVVTIFVNPTQFGPHEDFARYPRTLEADAQLLAGHGVDLIYAPSTEAMYRAQHATYVMMEGPALVLEGEFRPGHFRGVATIVLKLFNLVQPDRAYFGRKDFQQALLMRHMVADLNLPIHVEICPIVREADGLALSSRNVYLSPDERRRALAISQCLRLARQLVAEGKTDARAIVARMRAMLDAASLQIDYVALADPNTLAPIEQVTQPTVAAIAARVGATRLIDNMMLGETD